MNNLGSDSTFELESAIGSASMTVAYGILLSQRPVLANSTGLEPNIGMHMVKSSHKFDQVESKSSQREDTALEVHCFCFRF